MKNINALLLLTILFTASFLHAQDSNVTRIPLIGEEAPSFVAKSTIGEIKFPEDFFTKWKILFSHPADFTPVCSSEILEMAKLQEDFNKLNTAIMVISTDGINSHIEWVNSLEGIEYKQGPKVKINFPLIADDHLEISRKYGMIHPAYSDKKDIRGVFIVDPLNKIQAIFFYPASTGRNFEEIKRTLIALQESEKAKIFTPANWHPGDDVMLPAPVSKVEADKLKLKNDPKLYNYTWYMWFKKTQ
jgi:peroxiredoxin (alkyl hydroperoxide reductase subunit C)